MYNVLSKEDEIRMLRIDKIFNDISIRNLISQKQTLFDDWSRLINDNHKLREEIHVLKNEKMKIQEQFIDVNEPAKLKQISEALRVIADGMEKSIVQSCTYQTNHDYNHKYGGIYPTGWVDLTFKMRFRPR